MKRDKREYTGRIVDENGEPIPGARVLTWEWDHDAEERRVDEATTGPDGRFSIRGGDDHDQTLWADAPGLARAHFSRDAQRHGHLGDFGDLRLSPGVMLSGRAVDEHGRAIPGAEVVVESRYHQLANTVTRDGPPVMASTDDEGRFSVGPFGPGSHSVRVCAEGDSDGESGATVGPADDDIDLGDIELDRESVVNGVVVDPDGAPIEGARVTVDFSHVRATKSDESGAFEVRGQDGFVRQLRIHADGFRSQSVGLDERQIGLRVELHRAWEITGVAVDDETGDRVEIADLMLCQVMRKADGTKERFG